MASITITFGELVEIQDHVTQAIAPNGKHIMLDHLQPRLQDGQVWYAEHRGVVDITPLDTVCQATFKDYDKDIEKLYEKQEALRNWLSLV